MAQIKEVRSASQATRYEPSRQYVGYRVTWDQFGHQETVECKTLAEAKSFCERMHLEVCHAEN